MLGAPGIQADRKLAPFCGALQAVLVYTEGVLIAQYVWQIPTRLGCPWITPMLRARMGEVGLPFTLPPLPPPPPPSSRCAMTSASEFPSLQNTARDACSALLHGISKEYWTCTPGKTSL